MTMLNNFNRSVLLTHPNYVDLILARILSYGPLPKGSSIRRVILVGGNESINEFPDQRMYDDLGFVITINSTEGREYTPREIVRYLTEIDEPAYDNLDIPTFINQVFLNTFPLMR